MKYCRMAHSQKNKRFDADVLEGTVDESYRGTVGVIINSHETEPFGISIGTKIAQMVIERYVVPEMCVVDELDDTERGIGGFGHTGANNVLSIKGVYTCTPFKFKYMTKEELLQQIKFIIRHIEKVIQ